MYIKSLSDLKGYVESLNITPTEKLMILVGEDSSRSLDELRNYLKDKNINFFGGIYSRLLVGSTSLSEGYILQKYEPIYDALVFPHLMRFKLDPESLENCTALVLIDGLSSMMRDLTDTIYGKVGNKIKYIGGGAGFYDLVHRPCIFDNNGIYKDALYICIVKSKVVLAVNHGWKKLDGPFFVTKSSDNVLSTLDNYGAFEIYRDVIEDAEGIRIGKEDFFRFAKDHPFGISNPGSELIVRDPISVNEDDEITCVADIPYDSQLYVLKGDANSLLSSSLEIVKKCSSNAPDKYTPLLFDCISRAMFLDDRFEEELNNIQNKLQYPVEGALSIGEISSNAKGEIVIHNKSTILGLLDNECRA